MISLSSSFLVDSIVSRHEHVWLISVRFLSPKAATTAVARRHHDPPKHIPGPLGRETSGASVGSASKTSVVWDALWSLDVSYEGGRKGK